MQRAKRSLESKQALEAKHLTFLGDHTSVRASTPCTAHDSTQATAPSRKGKPRSVACVFQLSIVRNLERSTKLKV